MNSSPAKQLNSANRILNSDYGQNNDDLSYGITLDRPVKTVEASIIESPIPHTLFTSREGTKMSLNAVKLESV